MKIHPCSAMCDDTRRLKNPFPSAVPPEKAAASSTGTGHLLETTQQHIPEDSQQPEILPLF